MRKLSAHYIFPAKSPPLKFGILVLDEEGRILDLIDTGGVMKEESNLEFYPGILTPGFVNTHCHLELSHLHNRIPKQTGMSAFVGYINELRTGEIELINKKIRNKAADIYRSGTSAVGDIVNTTDTIATKKDSPVLWHSFIELFGLEEDRSNNIWQNGKNIESEFHKNNLKASLSPHAPYSVSRDLWNHFKSEAPDLISMHNQESIEEEDLMSRHEGIMADWFRKRGFRFESLPERKRSSLEAVLEYLPQKSKLLLVHNTHTTKDDIEALFKIFQKNQVYWALCPNSNLYIENSLPEEIISNRKNLNICLGTDSLASNASLSILEEMKTLQNHFPSISLEELIKWASLEGSKALGIDDNYGSFEKGKKPGVVWIKNLTYPGPRLTGKSQSERLV